MTDLSKFHFYLYDSIVDQGLLKTLILAVDGDTGETRIISSSDGSSDYIDINPRDINILEENTNSYSKAYLLRQDYQTEIDRDDFDSPKLELRVQHLNNVISRYKEWFMENNHSRPDPSEIIPDLDEIQDTNSALWSIADDMRTKKEDGTFVTYISSYKWAARNMRQNGNRFTAKSLQNAYHKAKSSGQVD
mgnify:CR=1 FL=1